MYLNIAFKDAAIMQMFGKESNYQYDINLKHSSQ